MILICHLKLLAGHLVVGHLVVLGLDRETEQRL